MRLKSMVAIVLGLGMIGLGVWRFTHGQVMPAAVVGLIGVFLLLRGASNTVRPGL